MDAVEATGLLPRRQNSPIQYMDTLTGSEPSVLATAFGAIILLHSAMAFASAPRYEFSEQFYPINLTSSDTSVLIDVTFTHILDSHRFVRLEGSAVRVSSDYSTELPLTINFSSLFTSNFETVRFDAYNQTQLSVKFDDGQFTSSLFTILDDKVESYDMIEIRMQIDSNFSEISGFAFTWSSFSADSETYLEFCRRISSLMIVTALAFFPLSSFTSEFPWHLIMVSLGALNSVAGSYSAIDLTALVILMRVFLIVDLELSEHSVFLIVLLVCLGIADFYCQRQRNREKSLPKEDQTAGIVVVFAFFFAVANLLYLFSMLPRPSRSIEAFSRKSSFHRAIFSYFCAISAGVSCLRNGTSAFLPGSDLETTAEMIFESFHLTIAVFIVFLLHPSEAGALLPPRSQLSEPESHE
jgi:hypothetical protein